MAEENGSSPLLAELSLAGDLPFLDGDLGAWLYLAISAVLFMALGIVTGNFIWRRGHLQTIDAATEIRKTSEDLTHMREDLRLETLEIGSKREEPVVEGGD